MDTPILASKLNIPGVRPDAVPRSHLNARLQSGLSGKLILVSAPAGYGKTTLLAGWLRELQQGEQSLAWLSLHAEDSDPARFTRYLVTAFRQFMPSVGDSTLARLDSDGSTVAPALLTPLINEMAAVHAGGVLVLDDYHALHGLDVHEITSFLLEHLPPQFHLVIATREDPPLPLARLRARAQVCELRAADLCFSPEEASLFLQGTMGLSLSPSQVEALERRTEGWVAGLQLAALSLQNRTDVAGSIRAFTGANRYILDYLVDEVFNLQPPEVQTFLLHTCAVGRLCAPLCAALLGDALISGDALNSQAMLEQLERANLFLVGLDLDRTWYRYHQLFADLLQARLRAHQPDLLPELHRRASRWFESNGLHAEAIEHALAAPDLPSAADLISRAVSHLSLEHYALNTLMRWLEALPPQVVRSRPRLAVDYAWILASKGRTSQAEEIAREAEQQLAAGGDTRPTADSRGLLGEIASLLTLLAVRRNDLDEAIAMSRKALDMLPPERSSARAEVIFFLADGYVLANQLDRATEAYAQAAELSSASADTFTTLLSLHRVATVQAHLGHLHEAAATYRRAIALADDGARGDPGEILPIAGMPHTGLGQLLAEWGRLDEAIEHLARGTSLLSPIGDWNTNLLEGLAAIARVKRVQGDLKGAAEIVTQTAQLAERSGPGREHMTRPAEWSAALQWLSTGHIERAVRWAEDAEEKRPDLPARGRETEISVLARIYLAAADPEKALRLLREAGSAAEAAGRKAVQIELLVVQALALQATGRAAGAVEALGKALTLAEPEEYSLAFIEHGAPVQALLREAVRRDVAAAYASRVLAHPIWAGVSGAPSPSDAGILRANRLVEPLSDREQEVLRLLVSGLSGPEIARHLVVGSSTVKSHLKSIYGKLDVHSRDQAIARARELRLI